MLRFKNLKSYLKHLYIINAASYDLHEPTLFWFHNICPVQLDLLSTWQMEQNRISLHNFPEIWNLPCDHVLLKLPKFAGVEVPTKITETLNVPSSDQLGRRFIYANFNPQYISLCKDRIN